MILHGNGVYKLLGPYIPETLLPFNQDGKSILISLENVIAFCSSNRGHSSHPFWAVHFSFVVRSDNIISLLQVLVEAQGINGADN